MKNKSEIQLNRQKRLKQLLDDLHISPVKLSEQLEDERYSSLKFQYIYKILKGEGNLGDNHIDDILTLYPHYDRRWLAGDPTFSDDDVRRFIGADEKLSGGYLFISMCFLLHSMGYDIEVNSHDGKDKGKLIDIWDSADSFLIRKGNIKYVMSAAELKKYMEELRLFSRYYFDNHAEKADA